MNRNRKGARHNNWVSRLRTDYARTLERRRRDEAEAEKPPSDPGKVEITHWYIKQNAKTHNTIKFDLIHDKKEPKPVLRRGQPFYLAIRFISDFDVAKDRVVLHFKFGAKASVQKGTLAIVPAQNEKFTLTKDDWDCRIDPGTRGKDLVLQVNVPASASVGIWRLDVHTGLQDTTRSTAMNLHHDETDCYILFNPWCKDDAVYVGDEAKREEYVNNDKGKVYVGTNRRSRGRPWAYGQFDDVVLRVATYILEISRVVDSERGNPVKVVRGISAGVNAEDEDGILASGYDGKYSDGTAPFKWTGSVRILEEFVMNGYQPVKYGQCWVFSALVTTICRALGIPCRSVTNYVSAHDANSSLTIDKYFDEQGNKIDGPDSDKIDYIWKFHVWNDVWMVRSDLPPGYGGWQAIDSTPRKKSDHKKQCGPVSLEAVRRGDISYDYDAPFVFAEVNADVMQWREDPWIDFGWSLMRIKKHHVGRKILTKKVGKDDDDGDADQEDVVREYKSEEGSSANHLAIQNAIMGCRLAQQYYEVKKDIKEDCVFDLIDINKITIGQPFKVKVVVRNESTEPRKITAVLNARSVYYTGVSLSLIKKFEETFTLGPKQSQDIFLTITYSEYWMKLVEQCMIKMYAICRVQETGQMFIDEDDFQVDKPKLTVEVQGTAEVKKMCQATLSFTNPLDMPLTEGNLSVDGAGLMRPRAITLKKEVPPKGKFTHTLKFLPRIHGERKLIASFNAKELFDINGTKTINVKKAAA